MSEIRNDDERYEAWTDYVLCEGNDSMETPIDKISVKELALVEKGFMAGWFHRGKPEQVEKAEGA